MINPAASAVGIIIPEPCTPITTWLLAKTLFHSFSVSGVGALVRKSEKYFGAIAGQMYLPRVDLIAWLGPIFGWRQRPNHRSIFVFLQSPSISAYHGSIFVFHPKKGDVLIS